MIRWLKEQWSTIALIAVIAAVGGLVGAAWPTLWFQHGVCW